MCTTDDEVCRLRNMFCKIRYIVFKMKICTGFCKYEGGIDDPVKLTLALLLQLRGMIISIEKLMIVLFLDEVWFVCKYPLPVKIKT